jgi:ADP-ribose pyrophosphatase YjhB (NUDIX family)
MSANRRRGTRKLHVTLAAAIVIHNDCVLIVRRSKKERYLPLNWGVPCGKVEARLREQTKEAVIRELYEETRLRGKVQKYVGQQEFASTWRGKPARNVQYNYLISLESGGRAYRSLWSSLIYSPRLRSNRMPRVKTPRRDQVSKWIPLDQVDHQPLDDHNRRAIRQGLKAYASGPHESPEAISASLPR